MTRKDQLALLIAELAPSESVPERELDCWRLFRALANAREPTPASGEFLRMQDEMLRSMIAEAGITDANALPELRPDICLWRGDITTIKADAIVNAANSSLPGCFVPGHRCIDNAIHTFAGVQMLGGEPVSPHLAHHAAQHFKHHCHHADFKRRQDPQCRI